MKKKKSLILIIIEVIFDAIGEVAYFIKNNLRNFARLLGFILPYVMYYVGQHTALENGTYFIGYEIFIPLAFTFIIYFLRSTANKLGKGITIPVPTERFTKVDDDGEVTIEQRRIQELILYVADLEDWLHRKGLL